MNQKILFFLLFYSCCIYSQSNPFRSGIQFGATLKAKIEFGNSKNEPNIKYRFSSNFGAASFWGLKEIYPAINAEFQFYNGGIGSRNIRYDKKNKSTNNEKNQKIYNTLDVILAFTMTGQLATSSNFFFNRNIPLRYFADFAIPSLQNPFDHSISLGTNLVYTTDSAREFQKVGFLNINSSGFQVSYYNDGTPFQYIYSGDGRDRFYTGGGVLSYNKRFGGIQNLDSYNFEISYHKFTGFNQSAFEISNDLHTSNVDYKEEFQKNYNKSLWKFNIQSSNQNQGFGLALSFYNQNKYDIQHWLHMVLNDSFHIVPYQDSFNVEPSFYILSNTLKN